MAAAGNVSLGDVVSITDATPPRPSSTAPARSRRPRRGGRRRDTRPARDPGPHRDGHGGLRDRLNPAEGPDGGAAGRRRPTVPSRGASHPLRARSAPEQQAPRGARVVGRCRGLALVRRERMGGRHRRRGTDRLRVADHGAPDPIRHGNAPDRGGRLSWSRVDPSEGAQCRGVA